MSGRDLPAHRLIIGMEVHLQLRTRSKCFCPCEVTYGAPPNTHVCPVCLGLPGALPTLNRAALEQAIRGGLGLGCDVAAFTKWDRKNYFYPDLPKGYQITQFDKPVCTDGELTVDGEDGPITVRIQRAHLEEDTGKSVHESHGGALVDLNRAGTPLLEIVTHPDLRTAADASAYLKELRRIMRYLDVSDADMEKGQLRCEPNVNVEIDVDGEWVPTRIVELKNLNSFSAVRNAIEYERARQVEDFVETGVRGPLPRSTRGWDDAERRTFLQREKEEAADYRYFPEPDLPPVTSAQEMADRIRPGLAVLPSARRAKFTGEFGLSAEHAAALASDALLADFYERVAAAAGDAQAAAGWVLTDVLREMNTRGTEPPQFPVTPENLAALVRAVQGGQIPREAAKTEVFPRMAETQGDPLAIARELGLEGTGGDELAAIAREVVAENPGLAAKYRSGKPQVIGVLLGQVMKRTRGTAVPAEARAALEAALG